FRFSRGRLETPDGVFHVDGVVGLDGSWSLSVATDGAAAPSALLWVSTADLGLQGRLAGEVEIRSGSHGLDIEGQVLMAHGQWWRWPVDDLSVAFEHRDGRLLIDLQDGAIWGGRAVGSGVVEPNGVVRADGRV